MPDAWRITSAELDEETGRPLFWSNELGWCDEASADAWPAPDVNLPIGGRWLAPDPRR